MKRIFPHAVALASALCLASTAYANNSTVENALKSREDLSAFYLALANTGVLSELKDGQPYTVFAPTNEALAKISAEKYPCFYSVECKGQVAEILRRHIVPGEKHLADIQPEGGTISLFSIDNQHVVANEPFKDRFTVNGQKVISEHQLLGGDLYKIDGLMADPRDMAQFEPPRFIYMTQAMDDQVRATRLIITSKTDATTPIPY